MAALPHPPPTVRGQAPAGPQSGWPHPAAELHGGLCPTTPINKKESKPPPPFTHPTPPTPTPNPNPQPPAPPLQGTDVVILALGDAAQILEGDLAVCGGQAVVHILNDTLRWEQSTAAAAAATGSAALAPRGGWVGVYVGGGWGWVGGRGLASLQPRWARSLCLPGCWCCRRACMARMGAVRAPLSAA